MHNILKDVSAMTNVPQARLNEISKCIEYAISDIIWEAKNSGENRVDIDCGFGVLTMVIAEREIKCSFKVSAKLSKRISHSMEANVSPTEVQIEKLLAQRIEETYKELCR